MVITYSDVVEPDVECGSGQLYTNQRPGYNDRIDYIHILNRTACCMESKLVHISGKRNTCKQLLL